MKVNSSIFATDAGLSVAAEGSATLVFNRALNAANTEAWLSARLR